jgi:hypothetical protein
MQWRSRCVVAALLVVSTGTGSCGQARDAANDPNDGHGQGSTNGAVDGEHALMSIAKALCNRMQTCMSQLQVGFPYSSVQACADKVVIGLDPLQEVTCAPESDYSLPIDVLRPCVAGLNSLDCSAFFGRGWGQWGDSCLETFTALARMEEAQIGAKAIGDPCEPQDYCPFDAYCAEPNPAPDATSDYASFASGPGICRSIPRAGEPCARAGALDPARCSSGTYCIHGVCSASLPQPGEQTCFDIGQCTEGLDCNAVGGAEGLCQVAFRVGDPCDAQSRCGDWLACVDGTCRSRIDASRLGAECIPGASNDCLGSKCLQGRCVALSDVGEPCTFVEECLIPYACVMGKCTAVPACKSGEQGEVCSSSDQCADNLECFPNNCSPIQ